MPLTEELDRASTCTFSSRDEYMCGPKYGTETKTSERAIENSDHSDVEPRPGLKALLDAYAQDRQ